MQRKRMNTTGQFLCQETINSAMALDRVFTGKRSGRSHNLEMCFRTGSDIVIMALINHLQVGRRQSLGKFGFYLCLNLHSYTV